MRILITLELVVMFTLLALQTAFCGEFHILKAVKFYPCNPATVSLKDGYTGRHVIATPVNRTSNNHNYMAFEYDDNDLEFRGRLCKLCVTVEELGTNCQETYRGVASQPIFFP
jgi:hypothetical protein